MLVSRMLVSLGLSVGIQCNLVVEQILDKREVTGFGHLGADSQLK